MISSSQLRTIGFFFRVRTFLGLHSCSAHSESYHLSTTSINDPYVTIRPRLIAYSTHVIATFFSFISGTYFQPPRTSGLRRKKYRKYHRRLTLVSLSATHQKRNWCSAKRSRHCNPCHDPGLCRGRPRCDVKRRGDHDARVSVGDDRPSSEMTLRIRKNHHHIDADPYSVRPLPILPVTHTGEITPPLGAHRLRTLINLAQNILGPSLIRSATLFGLEMVAIGGWSILLALSWPPFTPNLNLCIRHWTLCTHRGVVTHTLKSPRYSQLNEEHEPSFSLGRAHRDLLPDPITI